MSKEGTTENYLAIGNETNNLIDLKKKNTREFMHSYKNSNLKKQTIWYRIFISRKKKWKERNKRDEYVWKRTTYRFGNWN